MIKQFWYTMCSVFLLSCGGGNKGGDTIEDVLVATPVLSEPSNQFICLNHENIDFSWSQSTGAQNYLLEVATDKQFLEKVSSISAITQTNKTVSLNKATTYYWRVKAIGNDSESEYSSIFQFYTQGDAVINHLPKTPSIISPENGDEIFSTSVSLEWESTDEDSSDVLVFDVYLGTEVANLELISENQTSKTHLVNVTLGTSYYWRIAAKDNHGGVALGSVSNFNVQ